jgi:hypothetical protein
MRSPEHILRHVVRCDWRCKHCGEVFGSERVAHYGAELPDLIKPTWFFAAMTLLDHLRDCGVAAAKEAAEGGGGDHSRHLRQEFGEDFLNHPSIYTWYNQHALIERHFLAQEELE